MAGLLKMHTVKCETKMREGMENARECTDIIPSSVTELHFVVLRENEITSALHTQLFPHFPVLHSFYPGRRPVTHSLKHVQEAQLLLEDRATRKHAKDC